MRTRVGYAGGTVAAPTYNDLGDHTEIVEVDYVPALITYEQLLDAFWRWHDPRRDPATQQYRSVVLYREEAEREAAEASKASVERELGPVTTRIEPLDVFWPAEAYHQKHRLRNTPEIMCEFRQMYPDDAGLTDSTAAARVNGWLSGCGMPADTSAALAPLGLSEVATAWLERRLSHPAVRPGTLL